MEHRKNSETRNDADCCCEERKPALHWPPSQHLLDNFKYEVGGELFTLVHYPGRDRVQLKMSRVQTGEGLAVECVATIGPEFDAMLACPFEHVSAVAAAIPRAEVFLRNLYEQADPKLDLPSVLPPDGSYWSREGAAVFLRSNSDGNPLASIPEDEEERDALLACIEAFDPKMVGEFDWPGEVMAHGNLPPGLAPGRYAMSFRKLPNAK